MSQFYDQASLVMVPSGYKAGKVYSQKPLSTDGELTFTRNSNATRVNADGLVEKVRENVLLYSNDFTNAAWVALGTPTLTANYDNNPLTGANDAWRFQSASASDRIYQACSVSFHNFSLYAKGTGTLRIRDNSNTYGLDMVLTSSWQRASVHIPVSAVSVQITSTGGCDATIYAAQLETGDIATQYIPTTSAAVSVGATPNTPRLNYSNGCPSLLLEPQTTSLILFSEQIDNAAYTKVNSSVTANATTAPDGYNGADLLTSTASGALIRQEVSATSTSITFSAFVKSSSGDGTSFIVRNVSTSTNLAVIGFTGSAFTPDAGGQTIDYGNGWYRISVTATSGITAGNTIRISIYSDSSLGTIASSSVFVWGINLTNTAYLQSYIPTLGASVTRLADSASRTNIANLIGQTEGTIFGQFANPAKAAQGRYFSISDGTGNNRIDVYALSPTSIGIYAAKAGTAIINTSFAVPANAPFKYAIAYKAGQWTWYLNGVQIGTSADTNVPAMSNVQVTTASDQTPKGEANPVVQALLFKTRLSNADLATLTAL